MHRVALLLAASIFLGAGAAGAQAFRGAHSGGAVVSSVGPPSVFQESKFCCGPGSFPHFGGLHHGRRLPPAIFVSAYDDYAPFEDASRLVVLEEPTNPANRIEAPATTAAARQDVQNSPGAKFVEFPPAAAPMPGTASHIQAPAVFLLVDGRRIEAQRYTITDRYVSVVTGRREARRILLDELNVEATIAANKRNGIDLRIPSTRNELFLSY